MPKVTHVDPDYKMNYDQILDKPFLVDTINWDVNTADFTELARLPFPSSIMTNPLAKVPFEASTFFQARMCCMMQVSGTPMHQGLILAAAVPHGTPRIFNANQILSAPHVFLNATESTSVCLECPMYTPSTLYRTQTPAVGQRNRVMNTSTFGQDVFDLVFFVMDALTTAAGSSTAITISVHNIFKEAQFYVPKVGAMEWQAQCGVYFPKRDDDDIEESRDDESSTNFVAEGFVKSLWKLPTQILDDLASGLKVVTGDLIDYGRGMIKTLTGFHNPNVPEIKERVLNTFRNFPNNVDQPVHLEVLDNHAQFSRIYDDYYFRTKQDEMDLKFLTSKPVFVGKFKVSSNSVTGQNLFAYPMTPMVEGATSDISNAVFYSPLRTIYEASRFWRGNLKMHIQAVCTNFHFCKIIVVKNYATTSGIAGNTTAVVPQYDQIHNLNNDTLEFSAGGQIQTIDLKFNSNLRQIECTKDYVANAVSHGVAYGYLVQPLSYNSNVPTSITFNVYISGGDDLQFSGYALDPIDINVGSPPPLDPIEEEEEDNQPLYFKAEADEKEQPEGIEALVTPNSQEEVLNRVVPCTEDIKMALRPNTSVRDYLRYMYPQPTIQLVPTQIKNVYPIDLARMMNRLQGTYFQAISSLYMGMSGGLKLKFKISGVSNASAMYVPPSTCCIDETNPQVFPMKNGLPSDPNSLSDFTAGMTYNPSGASYTAPQIEMQDYTRPYNNAANTVASRPGSTFVLEMAIPNMNQFNFVGNASKWYGDYDAEGDLGVVYINYDASYDGSDYARVDIIPFIGINDETRLGFQVYAPKKTILAYLEGSTNKICRSSVLHPFIPNYPNGIIVTPPPATNSAYFFNTV